MRCLNDLQVLDVESIHVVHEGQAEVSSQVSSGQVESNKQKSTPCR